MVAIGVVFLLVWFFDDVIIGATIQGMKTDEARRVSVRTSNYTLNPSGPNSMLAGLEGIREATIIPIRVAGVLSAILLLALSPIP